jgi:hypothetical protein
MSETPAACRHARVQIGGDPQHLTAEVRQHVEGCAACAKFLAEMLELDGKLRGALEMPLAGFRTPAVPEVRAPRRRFALAASVVLAVLLGGGFWLLRPQNALAAEVIEHVLHEAGSWERHANLPPGSVANVLHTAGVEFSATLPVVYASACDFRGRRVPHLVVQTAQGPMTVMLLANEQVERRTEFAEEGLRGVLLPAGSGSVALLTRGAAPSAQAEGAMVSAVRWR